MQIADILRHKGSDVVTIGPAESVSALLARLAEHGIGALVVTQADAVVGIVSERDVARSLAARGESVLQGTVADIMTADVLTCAGGDGLDAVATTMTERRVRHMPVVDAGQLVGLVSIGDVVLSRIRQLEHDRGHLEQYITG